MSEAKVSTPLTTYVHALSSTQMARWVNAVSQETGLGFHSALDAIYRAARIFDVNPNAVPGAFDSLPAATAESVVQDSTRLPEEFASLMSAMLSPDVQATPDNSKS